MKNDDVNHHIELKRTKKLDVGIDFLHTHHKTEKELGLDNRHVIVDKTDYENAVKFLKRMDLYV